MNTPGLQFCLKMQPLKAKSSFKDTAIVFESFIFFAEPLEGINKCDGWTLHPFSGTSANSPSLTSQHWCLGREGIQDRPVQRTRRSPCRDEGKQGLLLDPVQNTEPSHNMSTQCVCLRDMESYFMSAFTIKHDFDIIMVVMLLYLQYVMGPGSVRVCLLFMRDFVFAMIGEQGVLEALFSWDLVNFLRIFL